MSESPAQSGLGPGRSFGQLGAQKPTLALLLGGVGCRSYTSRFEINRSVTLQRRFAADGGVRPFVVRGMMAS